jgi:hypothetical protein
MMSLARILRIIVQPCWWQFFEIMSETGILPAKRLQDVPSLGWLEHHQVGVQTSTDGLSCPSKCPELNYQCKPDLDLSSSASNFFASKSYKWLFLKMWHWVLLELWCLLYYVQSVICHPKDGIVVESGNMVSTAIARRNNTYDGWMWIRNEIWRRGYWYVMPVIYARFDYSDLIEIMWQVYIS